MSNLTINLSSPKEFARFALKYGTKAEASIFQGNAQLSGRRYNDNPNTKAKTFSLFVPFSGRDAEVTYTAAPTLPTDWHHGDDLRIAQTFSAKTDAVKYLRNTLKADAEKLAVFSKVTVSQLQQIIDASDEDAEEVTVRNKHDKDDKFTIPVSGLGLKEVLVTVKKPRGSSQLEYVLSVDYSDAWAQVNRDVEDMLKELSNFSVFKTV